MKQFKNVRGTQEKVETLEVNVDTVYSRSNIKRIESDEFTGWEYDELQYSLREYQESLGGMTISLDKSRESLTKDLGNLGEQGAITIFDVVALGEAVGALILEVEKLKNGGKKA